MTVASMVQYLAALAQDEDTKLECSAKLVGAALHARRRVPVGTTAKYLSSADRCAARSLT